MILGHFNVAILTLDSREAPYSGPFCEEKQRPGVEGERIEFHGLLDYLPGLDIEMIWA